MSSKVPTIVIPDIGRLGKLVVVMYKPDKSGLMKKGNATLYMDKRYYLGDVKLLVVNRPQQRVTFDPLGVTGVYIPTGPIELRLDLDTGLHLDCLVRNEAIATTTRLRHVWDFIVFIASASFNMKPNS